MTPELISKQLAFKYWRHWDCDEKCLPQIRGKMPPCLGEKRSAFSLLRRPPNADRPTGGGTEDQKMCQRSFYPAEYANQNTVNPNLDNVLFDGAKQQAEKSVCFRRQRYLGMRSTSVENLNNRHLCGKSKKKKRSFVTQGLLKGTMEY